MLCFLFAALIVALDQFFKHWVIRTIEIGHEGPELIPGVLGLTRWENDGAMLNILSGQQWLLAGIAFGAAVILIMILLRYNEGFWGTLGLAAVLGGTVGNLVDRITNEGKVVDMFRTLFIDFPIFNFADVFITLGFITFLIHFIAISFKAEKSEIPARDYNEYTGNDYYEGPAESEYDEFPEIDSIVSAQAEQDVSSVYEPQQYNQQYSQMPQYYSEPEIPVTTEYESITETTPEMSFTLDALEAEIGSLDSLEDYNVEDLLREYGFDDDDNLL